MERQGINNVNTFHTDKPLRSFLFDLQAPLPAPTHHSEKLLSTGHLHGGL